MRSERWRVLVVVATLLSIPLILDARSPVLRAVDPIPESFAVTLVAPTDAASSTWYCVGGTVGAWLPEVSEDDENEGELIETWEPQDGFEAQADVGNADDQSELAPGAGDSEHTATPTVEAEPVEDVASGPIEANQTLVLANPTSELRHSKIMISVGREAPVVLERELKPSTVERVSLSEYGDADITAALVEIDGGGVAVGQLLEGPLGKDFGECVSTTSDVWYFADGITTRDSRYVMSLFNPFPGDAVVDFTFRTPDGIREPKALRGVIVPGRSVVAVDVGAEVTRREHVATMVQTRSGQIVAQRWQTFNGALDHRGVLSQRGVVSPPLVNVFVLGRKDDLYQQSLVVYNPSDQPAEVDVALVDTPQLAGTIDPFELSLEPNSFRVLELWQESRILDAIGADSGEFAVVVTSLNGVGVISELSTFLSDGTGVASSLGTPAVAQQQLILNPGSLGSRSNRLRVFNPGDETLEFSVEIAEGGVWRSIPEAAVTIEPGRRVMIDLDDLNLGAATLVLNGSGVFVAELATTVTNEDDLLIRGAILTEAGLFSLE